MRVDLRFLAVVIRWRESGVSQTFPREPSVYVLAVRARCAARLPADRVFSVVVVEVGSFVCRYSVIDVSVRGVSCDLRLVCRVLRGVGLRCYSSRSRRMVVGCSAGVDPRLSLGRAVECVLARFLISRSGVLRV